MHFVDRVLLLLIDLVLGIQIRLFGHFAVDQPLHQNQLLTDLLL